MPLAEEIEEEIEFEAAEAEEIAEDITEDDGESVRQTEPFPIKPAPKEAGGGEWDFLKRKKK